jgi:hypothetical protein
MRFQTLAKRHRPGSSSPDGAYLEANGWNDYGFETLWTLYYVQGGNSTLIGSVKIGDLEGSNDQNLWMALGLVTWTGAPSRG